jgi:hypothetical protein
MLQDVACMHRLDIWCRLGSGREVAARIAVRGGKGWVLFSILPIWAGVGVVPRLLVDQACTYDSCKNVLLSTQVCLCVVYSFTVAVRPLE